MGPIQEPSSPSARVTLNLEDGHCFTMQSSASWEIPLSLHSFRIELAEVAVDPPRDQGWPSSRKYQGLPVKGRKMLSERDTILQTFFFFTRPLPTFYYEKIFKHSTH